MYIYLHTALLSPCSWLFCELLKCSSCLWCFHLQTISHKAATVIIVQGLPIAFRMRSILIDGNNKAWHHVDPSCPSGLHFSLSSKPLARHSLHKHMLNIHSLFTLPRMTLFLFWLSLLILVSFLVSGSNFLYSQLISMSHYLHVCFSEAIAGLFHL